MNGADTVSEQSEKVIKVASQKTEIQQAREYIEYFQKYCFRKPIGFVDTAGGRRLFLATAKDDEIIWIAEQFKKMEIEAAQNHQGAKN